MIQFIPQIWAARLLSSLQKALVYAQAGVVNREYEGEIQKYGDSVRIGSIGDPTIGNYTKDTDIAAPESLTDAEQSLVIDQSKYFNIYVDEIDKAQQNVNSMEEAMSRAGYKLKDLTDQFVAAAYVNVAAANLIGSDAAPSVIDTAPKAYEHLVDLGVKLDEANIPSDGRSATIPPWFYGLLLKDDRFVKAGTAMTDATLRNGQVGEAAGFRILKSNNVPTTTGTTRWKVIASHPMAYTFADQIVDVKSYQPEKRFGNAVKGLHVYGGRLIRPTAWAVGTISKT